MATTAAATQPGGLIGAYLAQGIVGNLGMPGAPIMHYSLVVVPSAHNVSGTVEITQAIAPPGVHLTINVTGMIRKTGLGQVTQIVALEATENPQFSAHLAIDNSWQGRGGFSYNGTTIEDVPVTPKS